jgi:hypothetical protein
MPAFRNIPTRRSQRLSLYEPRSYHGGSLRSRRRSFPFRLLILGILIDDHDWEQLDLAYPPSYEPQTNATSISLSSSISSSPLSSLSDELSSLHATPFVPSASHARRRKAGHIPRPPNAFMIFRSDLWRKRKVDPEVERDHRNISVIAGILWRKLPPEEQKPYQLRAIQEKQRHALANPGYKYSPVVRKEKSGKKKTRNDIRDDQDKCKELASLWMKDLEEHPQDNALANVKCELSSPNPSVVSTARPSSRTSVLSQTVSQSTTVPGTLSQSALKEQTSPPFAMEFVPTEEIPVLELSRTTEDDVVRFPIYVRDDLFLTHFNRMANLNNASTSTFSHPDSLPPTLSPTSGSNRRPGSLLNHICSR